MHSLSYVLREIDASVTLHFRMHVSDVIRAAVKLALEPSMRDALSP